MDRRAELETLFLTRLMEIDAAIWSRWMRGTCEGNSALVDDDDEKNQDGELKPRALSA